MPGHISGTIRFSVESLLYYAPKVTGTGTTLESAVAAVQRRLLSLGDFFGDSWPDRPFRDSYPRAQYAMLIITRQLADEIQGIGGGIEQMARTYGITEDRNIADITRIGLNENRTSSLISRSGGLPQPPDTSLSVSAPQAPPPRIPHPRPNPAPVTPANTATLSGYVSAAPMPGPTPSPRPRADPTAWRQSDPVSILGPWPSGDPARMGEAADCWTTLHSALDTAWSDLRRYTTYILTDAQGPAADAFSDYVNGLTANGHGSLTRAIEMTQCLHDACLRQAEEIGDLRRKIEQAAIEFAATFVIGQIVSMVTFGSAEEATAAIEAGLTARLTLLADRLAADGTTLARMLNTAAVGASKASAAAVVSGMQSAMIGEADLGADNIVNKAFGEEPAQGLAAVKVLVESGGLGMILGQGSAGGVLGWSAATASKKLIDLGETLKGSEGNDGEIGATLKALGRQLKDGGITISAANATLTQLITNGKITPAMVFSGAVANRFTTAISPHTGKHAAD